MPDFAVATAFTGKGNIIPYLGQAGNAVDKFGQRGAAAFDKINTHSGFFSTRMKDIVGGVIGANLIERSARAVWDFAKNAIELASNLVEVQNVVDTTFGAGADSINKFAKSALKNFGLSELQAKQFTGTMGAMMKSSGLSGKEIVGMSQRLAGLTGDFSSFYNLPHDEAFQKIRSGISGETEPLKQIGINMSVANLEAFALTQGITKQYKAMTQAEQVMLRYNYLINASKDAQGDFAKTLDSSYANQKRVFMTLVQQTAANAMTKILPYLIDGFKILNKTLEYLPAILDYTIPLIKGFVIAWAAYKALQIGSNIYSAVTSIIQLRSTIGPAIKQMGLLSFITGQATASQWSLNAAIAANPFGLIATAISLAVMWIIYLNNNLAEMKQLFMDITAFLDKPWVRLLLMTLPGMSNAVALRDKISAQQAQAPNRAETERRNSTSNFEGTLNIAGAPKGSTIKETIPLSGFNLNMMGLNTNLYGD